MKAELKNLDLNSDLSVDTYRPDNLHRFGVWLTASIGPIGFDGADLFQVFACSPAWLEGRPESRGPSASCYILMDEYNPQQLRAILRQRIDGCIGDDWDILAEQVNKFSFWEFENYQP